MLITTSTAEFGVALTCQYQKEHAPNQRKSSINTPARTTLGKQTPLAKPASSKAEKLPDSQPVIKENGLEADER